MPNATVAPPISGCPFTPKPINPSVAPAHPYKQTVASHAADLAPPRSGGAPPLRGEYIAGQLRRNRRPRRTRKDTTDARSLPAAREEDPTADASGVTSKLPATVRRRLCRHLKSASRDLARSIRKPLVYLIGALRRRGWLIFAPQALNQAAATSRNLYVNILRTSGKRCDAPTRRRPSAHRPLQSARRIDAAPIKKHPM